MNWIFLALLAPFIYAVSVFLDKYLVSGKIPNYRSLPIFGVFISLPTVLILWFYAGPQGLLLKDALWIILSGAFSVWGFSLYLEALIKEETSVVIIIIQSVPIIVLILSYFILGDTVSQKQLVGFFLLCTSSISASIKKEKSSLKISKGLIYILLANLLWAFTYIFMKFVPGNISFKDLVLFESIGAFSGSLILLIFVSTVRKAFIETLKKIKKPVLVLVLINELLFLTAKAVTFFAVILGPAVLVSVLGSTQIFYGILIGLVLSLLLPKIFKENLSKQGLIKKVFLGLLAFIGVILVS